MAMAAEWTDSSATHCRVGHKGNVHFVVFGATQTCGLTSLCPALFPSPRLHSFHRRSITNSCVRQRVPYNFRTMRQWPTIPLCVVFSVSYSPRFVNVRSGPSKMSRLSRIIQLMCRIRLSPPIALFHSFGIDFSKVLNASKCNARRRVALAL